MDSKGVTSRIQGISHSYKPSIPKIPSGQLALAYITQTWEKDAKPKITNCSVKVIPMSDIEAMRQSIHNLFVLVAEERLKEERDLANSYLQLAGVLIAVIRTDGTIETINRKGCTTLGYRDEELIGADWFETVVPADIRDGLHLRFNRLIEIGIEPSASEKSPIIDRYGNLRQIRWHNTLIRNREGVITAVVSAGEEEEPEEHIYS
ncbi:DUF4815 domain-containing protein [Candidatus Nomurabacteria bacterium]|nr:DUF4815 domain-containing protein [Candidatus Nomurabacteria bacterium]